MAEKKKPKVEDSKTQLPEELKTEDNINNEQIDSAEVLDDLPPEVKKVMEMGFSMQRFSGPMPNPLVSKINEKHIDKILELSATEDANAFKDTQSDRKYNLVYFLLIISFFVFITLFLAKDNQSLFLDILKIVVSIGGGFGGGYGYKAYLDSKK